jgi:uncharacterized protein YjbI with pentapeptide repeats
MANPEHLQMLQRDSEWNQWRHHGDGQTYLNGVRPDLTGASLAGKNFIGVYLAEVDFIGANLVHADFSHTVIAGANFSGADLRDAFLLKTYGPRVNFSGATLAGADLTIADLEVADLTRAILTKGNLCGTILLGANLSEADLSEVILSETFFSNTNLTNVRGIETCVHRAPSTLDHRTLAKSVRLPLAFLRGCGLSDWEIEATKLYDQNLTSSQLTDILYRIHHLRTDPLIQFCHCFISHASQDQAFVDRLYADLQNQGVRCWAASRDMQTGARIRDIIDQQIRLRDKLLVVLSSASLASLWVEDEVEAALEEERTRPGQPPMLVPIKIDAAIEETNRAWARMIKRRRHIGDFTHWNDENAYQKALTRLLQDLNTTEREPKG